MPNFEWIFPEKTEELWNKLYKENLSFSDKLCDMNFDSEILVVDVLQVGISTTFCEISINSAFNYY